MKTRIFMMLTLIMACALFAHPALVQATAPESLVITANMNLTEENSAAGDFETSGLFVDSGNAFLEFMITGNTIHGVKTLQNAQGTITIKFQAQLTWTSEYTCFAEGRFVILSGTDAYQELHGEGETYAEIDLLTYSISATYTGKAHFD